MQRKPLNDQLMTLKRDSVHSTKKRCNLTKVTSSDRASSHQSRQQLTLRPFITKLMNHDSEETGDKDNTFTTTLPHYHIYIYQNAHDMYKYYSLHHNKKVKMPEDCKATKTSKKHKYIMERKRERERDF